MSEPNHELTEQEYIDLERSAHAKGARSALKWLAAALDVAGAPPGEVSDAAPVPFAVGDTAFVDAPVAADEELLLSRINRLGSFLDQVDVALALRPNRSLPVAGQERRLNEIAGWAAELERRLDLIGRMRDEIGQAVQGDALLLHPLARSVLDAIRASGPNEPTALETTRVVSWRQAGYPLVNPNPHFLTQDEDDIEAGQISARHFANEGLLRELMRELDRLEYPTVPYEDLRVGLIGRLEQGRKQWGTGTVPRPTRFPTYDDGRRAAASDLAIRLGVEHPASAATIDARISELLRAEEAHKRVREVGLVVDEVDAIPRSAPLPSWEEVADSLERLHVPGGTLYRSIRWDADGDRSPSAPVFVPDRVSG